MKIVDDGVLLKLLGHTEKKVLGVIVRNCESKTIYVTVRKAQEGGVSDGSKI